MNRYLYTLLYYLLLPAIFVRLKLRSRKAPAYAQRWRERLGFFPPPEATGGIWLHSVSVGETIAAVPLVKRIQQAYPHLPLTITTMTPTGSDRVRALFGDTVFHVYVPYDTPGAVGRFLNKVQPCLSLIMETELWPNLIHGCHERDIPVIIANARLSARSAEGYGRFSTLVGDMLQKVSLIAAQHEDDGQRFVGLGLAPNRLNITGSIKFDIRVPEDLSDQARALRQHWGDRSVWVAASTHDGEEQQVLDAHQALLKSNPDTLLILVPRHPERFNQVASLCEAQGFSMVRRSRGEHCGPDTQILLGDTMGELLLFFGTVDIAFVGGTLVENGGHNFLEPAALGVPVLAGSSVFNFTDISRMLIDAQAMKQAENANALAEQLAALLEDEERRREMGQAGLAVVDRNRGALDRLFEQVTALVPGAVPPTTD